MKSKNLFIMLGLIIIWSLFFAIYKYYLWAIFATETITLQYISGYLSIGTLIAYIFGGLFYEIAREKKYHFIIILGAILLFSLVYFHTLFPIKDTVFIAILTLGIGVFYGLWAVLKNILIANEIESSSLSDTQINGMANIAFITSIILGSILGGKIFEVFDMNGVTVIGIMLLIGLWIGLGGSYKNPTQSLTFQQNLTQYKRNFLSDFGFIVKKYWYIMIFIASMITIATILSQKAIEYFVENLEMSNSSAAMILLYSAVGSIIGNIVSMKIKNNKWKFFAPFTLIYAIGCFVFPFVIESFTYTSILAFFVGVFFGVSYNIIESDFFKNIGIDQKKSYGSVSLGILVSSITALLMFGVDAINMYLSFNSVYYAMGSIILLIAIIMFVVSKKNMPGKNI